MTDARDDRGGPSDGTRIWIRILVTPLLLAALLGVLYLHDATGLEVFSDVVLLLLGAAGAYEMARLIRASDRPVRPVTAAVFGGMLCGARLLGPSVLHLPAPANWRAFILAVALLALMFAHWRDTRPRAIEHIANTLVPIVYIGLLLSFTGDLMDFERPARVLVWVILTAKASDMGGWLVGKPFGRHKLIPSVSPGKSWEGLVGGLVGSVLVAALLPDPLDLPQQAWGTVTRVLFGLLVGGGAVVAGITWSGWKRRLGAKDSSRLMPEVGGIVDMVDSMLIAGPVALVFLWIA